MERWRRVVLLVLGYLESLIFSGIIFGWPSLIYILQQEGIYSNLCYSKGERPLPSYQSPDHNMTNAEDYGEVTGNTSEEAGLGRGVGLRCSAQDNEFTLLYTVAAIMYGLASIFIGFSLDHLGLWTTRLVGSFITAAGFFCLAFTTKEISWLLWPAMNLMAMGTNQLRMSCYQFTNLWPSRRTTIFYAYGSAFSISATMFTIVQHVYRLGVSYRILGLMHFTTLLNIRTLGNLNGIVCRSFDVAHPRTSDMFDEDRVYPSRDQSSSSLILAFMSMLTFPVTFLMPIMRIKEEHVKLDKNKNAVVKSDMETTMDLLPIKEEQRENIDQEKCSENEKVVINGSLKNDGGRSPPDISARIPLTYSLLSVSAGLHLLWHFVNFFMILFYSVSFNTWMYRSLTEIYHIETTQELTTMVGHYTGILGLCQLIGPLFIPLSGMFTDWRINLANKAQDPVERLERTLQASTFGTATATITLLSVMTCKMFVNKTAIYLSMVLIAISRPLVHSSCTSYVRTRFPGHHFNRLIGIFTTIVSVVMPVQYPIFIWMFSSDDNFKVANWMLVVSLVLSLVSPGHMMVKNLARKYAKQQLSYSPSAKKGTK